MATLHPSMWPKSVEICPIVVLIQAWSVTSALRKLALAFLRIAYRLVIFDLHAQFGYCNEVRVWFITKINSGNVSACLSEAVADIESQSSARTYSVLKLTFLKLKCISTCDDYHFAFAAERGQADSAERLHSPRSSFPWLWCWYIRTAVVIVQCSVTIINGEP